MSKEFARREASFLITNLLLSLILFGAHWYLLQAFAPGINLFFPLWQIYLFHFIVTTLFYTLINFKNSQGSDQIFMLFMIATFVKMILSIVFLLPLILGDFENKQPDVFNFFIPYFLYLFFEVIMITKFLQKKA